jgi:serine/threonine protein kinase
LYQILTGRLPFWPKKTIAQVAKLPAYEVLAGARTYEVQFPHSLWADISPTAQELVSRMLDRNPATRITAAEALQHPWMCATLGFMPMPSSDAAASANNVVGFKGVHGSTLHPALVPLSPGKASNSTPGPLSPQKSSPLRSMLSGELPPSVLVADLFRTPTPVMVPAAE